MLIQETCRSRSMLMEQVPLGIVITNPQFLVFLICNFPLYAFIGLQ